MASSKPILEKQSVTYQNEPEIEQFLAIYPFLRPLLSEALDQVATHFPTASVVVTVYTDPEILADKQLLIGINPLNYESEDAINRLEQLQLDWWGDAWAETEDKMTIVFYYQ